jgi:hypothetical protein
MGSDNITIFVGSVQFKTTRSLLKAIDGTLLSDLDETCNQYDKEENVYNFDRDPELFRHILNSYRIKEVHIPRTVCPFVYKKELQFWKIPIQLIAPCCWQYLSESNLEDLKIVVNEDNNYKTNWNAKNYIFPETNLVPMTEKKQEKEKSSSNEGKDGNMSKVWMFLEEPGSSTAAKVNKRVVFEI